MMLDPYQQTKNLLVSYSENKLRASFKSLICYKIRVTQCNPIFMITKFHPLMLQMN